MKANALKVTNGSTTATLEMMPRQVLVVRISGLLTAAALLSIKTDVFKLYAGQVRAFVVDYTRAVIALESTDLDAPQPGDCSDSKPALPPSAMVVSSDCVELFRGHSARMALRGSFRRVFTRQEPAMAWAQSMAARPQQ